MNDKAQYEKVEREEERKKKRNKYVRVLVNHIVSFDRNFLDGETQLLEEKRLYRMGGGLAHKIYNFKDDKYDLHIVRKIKIEHENWCFNTSIKIKDFCVYSDKFLFISDDSKESVIAMLEKIIKDYEIRKKIDNEKECGGFSEQVKEVESFLAKGDFTRD